MNHPLPSAGAGAASVAPVRNWADWERPVGRALPTPPVPSYPHRFYFGACLRKSPILLMKHLIPTHLTTPHFCHFGDNLFLQGTLSFLTAFTVGTRPWALDSQSPNPQGGATRGTAGSVPTGAAQTSVQVALS